MDANALSPKEATQMSRDIGMDVHEQWLGKIEHAGVRRRAELLYQQLDGLQALRRTLRPEVLAESQVVMPRWWPIGSRDARVRGRVSMHSLGVRGAVTQHRVSGWILCPLG